ncbi:hypothetical protein RHMOL_Rhmol08G0211800 [Rhododendron molle]|uniref:Uncharacterized protein n=1 Tax=Rhododendron molle TaxID=49168 RepID=A0ACC0MS41_RHOML|nr:hypothetical protein RHMOL_Rhmol08G0211800 [Rhododendron molle]
MNYLPTIPPPPPSSSADADSTTAAQLVQLTSHRHRCHHLTPFVHRRPVLLPTPPFPVDMGNAGTSIFRLLLWVIRLLLLHSKIQQHILLHLQHLRRRRRRHLQQVLHTLSGDHNHNHDPNPAPPPPPSLYWCPIMRPKFYMRHRRREIGAIGVKK